MKDTLKIIGKIRVERPKDKAGDFGWREQAGERGVHLQMRLVHAVTSQTVKSHPWSAEQP